MSLGKITTFLWFDTQAEEAAEHYTSIFKNSKITAIQRYGAVAEEMPEHGHTPNQVMTAAFELEGHKFVGLNGGPHFKFNEAISFAIECETQEEIDYYWTKLGEGGDPAKHQCGWLADKFGVSWQVVPTCLKDMIGDKDKEKSARATAAFMKMKKFDIAELRKAFEGEA